MIRRTRKTYIHWNMGRWGVLTWQSALILPKNETPVAVAKHPDNEQSAEIKNTTIADQDMADMVQTDRGVL